ncbi:MAG: hypothetical protein E7312_06955 [Clostridiales bacterium]|nr:hypothetical protein [Clostridiales bacterium]
MKTVYDFDKNFITETKIDRDDVEFYDPLQPPFRLYGAKHDGLRYARIDMKIAKQIGDGIEFLGANTAGVRIRFVTDSPFVTLSARLFSVGKMPHFPLTGSASFDIYGTEDGVDKYLGTATTNYNVVEDALTETVTHFETGTKERLITINFPLYTSVSELIIGLKTGSTLKEAAPYKYETPIVYYGSSITQGGCASRPGNSYQSIISRMLDCNFVNLGFSGGAKAEDSMMEYIAGLDMCAFVLDYDHNAPSVEHLENTHYKAYKKVRDAHPNIPIVMTSRPKYHLTEDELQRLDVIRSTYARATLEGDKNVYFIDGRALILPEWYECATVDNCHPNDIGFACMAKKIGEVLNFALNNLR